MRWSFAEKDVKGFLIWDFSIRNIPDASGGHTFFEGDAICSILKEQSEKIT